MISIHDVTENECDDMSLIQETIETDPVKAEEQRQKTFNGLTAREWTSMSRSVWNDVSSSPRQKKHLDHGATYPEKLCSRLIKMYSRKGDLILDPFLGTGTTVIAAMHEERRAIGIELTDRFFRTTSEEIASLFPKNQTRLDGDNCYNYTLMKGDCLERLKDVESSSVQLTVTSPPYADLIHKIVTDRTKSHKSSVFVIENNATTNLYSDDERDLGNMGLDKYCEKVKQIMAEIYRCTKKGGYNVWVVKDYRDTKHNIPYVDLHTMIADCGKSVGFAYHDLIIWDQNEHRKLVLLGYPSVFYVNQNNSFIIVLRKQA